MGRAYERPMKSEFSCIKSSGSVKIEVKHPRRCSFRHAEISGLGRTYSIFLPSFLPQYISIESASASDLINAGV
jgi:hypothetical protein